MKEYELILQEIIDGTSLDELSLKELKCFIKTVVELHKSGEINLNRKPQFNKTLPERYGESFPSLVKFIETKEPEVIAAFKKKYGESYKEYLGNSNLTKSEKKLVYNRLNYFDSKILNNPNYGYKKEKTLKNTKKKKLKPVIIKEVDPFNLKISEVFNSFPSEREFIELLLKNFFFGTIRKLSSEEIIAELRIIISKVVAKRNTVYKIETLKSELERLKYTNHNTNLFVLNNLDKGTIDLITRTFGTNLDRNNITPKETEFHMNNYLIPIYLYKLDIIYKDLNKPTLIEIFGSREEYKKFSKFLVTVDKNVRELFFKMFGKQLNVYDPYNGLTPDEIKLVEATLSTYKKERKEAENIENSKNLNMRKKVIEKDTVKLLFEYEDGTVQEGKYSIFNTMHMLSKYPILAVDSKITQEIMKRYEGDKFETFFKGKNVTVTILEIETARVNLAKSCDNSKSPSQDKIGEYVDASLKDDKAFQL